MDVIEDSLMDFLGEEVWRALRNKLDCSRGIRLENILERPTAVRFTQAINDILPPAAPFVLDKISTRLIGEFPRIRDAQQLSNFLHIVSEIQKRYDGTHVLSGIENHQHVALVYNSENDFSKILSSFRIAGIKKNWLNVLVCPQELQERAKALMVMGDVGLSAIGKQKQQQQHQDLVILECAHLDAGSNNNDGTTMKASMESKLLTACKIALREKKSGLNVLGLCASHLLAHENYSACMTLEDTWENLVSATGMPASLICPYMWTPRIPESRLEQNHNYGVRYL
ncbi:MAG TPA: MEDS domain-containing protein [Nitrososphaera sp.]|nr:MEDS domain-containing protein [Nitrososphaera sp.]